MNKINIFVYGSLREGFFNYEKYLEGNVLSNRKAKINNVTLYHMPYKGYPAVINGISEVVGEVIELSNYDEVIKAVDKMEGVLGEGNPNNEYNKVLVEVEFEDGTREKCYSYFYNKDVDEIFESEAVLVHHGDWKKYMKK